MTIELIEEHLCFGGVQYVYSHPSSITNCPMRFGLFLPPQAKQHKVPVLYWLSGLTANEQNFITKAGSQRIASQLGLAIVAPDTSPRGIELPGDRASDDFGVGAGFYLDAIKEPWSNYYRMFTYITEELPHLLNRLFPLNERRTGIFGHSMGGHGALTLALKKPEQYRSLSAFAPICAPMQCPWGQKAFKGYLGEDKELWKNYDACELVLKKGWPYGPILIDQGTQDPFIETELNPKRFEAACTTAGVDLNLRWQKGYDHNYYFIASFIEDHLRFHATQLEG
ncbi:S-formylglutathione hydrolase [Legionella maceachernii]|uniref:S-formylglutathione hydrolase n=1 Tax=Legionella maceachernii TaxID=466 RepID=A0A0W0VX12_9GAMM|nr:S-formylglutathione hydrolase [Legionella maceachernii]SJZ62154.1 S-formylglutathione hydrolase [Legionella maceachernii]SUP00957.1 S-formylglutathione hydrolase [Legionella maceachernii]